MNTVKAMENNEVPQPAYLLNSAKMKISEMVMNIIIQLSVFVVDVKKPLGDIFLDPNIAFL